jgi:hypothetical protein
MAAQQFDNSLEALGNLLYLLRRSLDDPARATHYLDLADQVFINIVENRPDHPASSASPDQKSLESVTRRA